MSKRISTTKQIVNEILDKGLANSTWRENNSHAYDNLLKYREDIERSVNDVLLKNLRQIMDKYREV